MDVSMPRLLILCLYALVLLSLSSVQAEDHDQLGGQKEVARGARAMISWKFDNMDYVIVGSDTTRYPTTYQVYVAPQQTTSYVIRAIHNTDTTERTWTVHVLEQDIPKEARRGPESAVFSLAPKASADASPYYVGYRQSGDIGTIASARIVHCDFPDSAGKALVMHTIFLDKNGNQLSSVDLDKFSISLHTKCNEKSLEYQPIIAEDKWVRSDYRMMMTLCLDRSASSEHVDASMIKAVSDFPFYLGSSDKLSVVTFNQESTLVCSHNSKDKLNNLAEMFSGESHGLNTMLKSAYTCMQKFEHRDKTRNVLVLVCTGSDNASFIYTAEDLIQRALQKQVKIFTVGIGDLVETYPLRYISSQTGGRHYSLPTESIMDLTSILREINYSIHGSYLMQIPVQRSALTACDSASLRLVVKAGSNELHEQMSFYGRSANSQPNYQAIAMFGFRQTSISDEYLPLLRSVAQVLRDNPKKVIEICGNANAEGDEDAMRQLALDRVRSVRKALAEMGVNPMQVRGKALGDLRPLFYFQNEDWKKKFNRRVELRWIDPSLLPFELVAEYCYTENEALKYCEQWEKRGFKTYYERVLVKGMSAFRIKLWGYATEEKAQAESASIRKKYGQNLDVE